MDQVEGLKRAKQHNLTDIVKKKQHVYFWSRGGEVGNLVLQFIETFLSTELQLPQDPDLKIKYLMVCPQ